MSMDSGEAMSIATQTTNNTATVLSHWEIPAYCTCRVGGIVIGRSPFPDGQTSTHEFYYSFARDDDGLAYQLTGATVTSDKSPSATNHTISCTVSGTGFNLLVTGETGSNINWGFEAKLLLLKDPGTA